MIKIDLVRGIAHCCICYNPIPEKEKIIVETETGNTVCPQCIESIKRINYIGD